MSQDFYFYVESRANGGWDVPDAFTPPDAPLHRRVQAFAWLGGSAGIRGLFFGDEAPVAFRAGHPPAWESSALHRWMRPDAWAGEPDTPRISWLPFAELMVDLWDATRIVVAGRVPAPHAALFGDGSQPFPESALRAAGWDGDAVRLLRQSPPALAPLDRTHGQARHEVLASDPHRPLDVTWCESISDYLGRERADAFRSLRRFGGDAELRVIAVFA